MNTGNIRLKEIEGLIPELNKITGTWSNIKTYDPENVVILNGIFYQAISIPTLGTFIPGEWTQISSGQDLRVANFIVGTGGITKDKVVKIDTDGRIILAFADSLANCKATIGIALSDGIENEIVSIGLWGLFQSDDWSFGNLGIEVYLSDSVPGELTFTPPTALSSVRLRIANIVAADSILLRPEYANETIANTGGGGGGGGVEILAAGATADLTPVKLIGVDPNTTVQLDPQQGYAIEFTVNAISIDYSLQYMETFKLTAKQEFDPNTFEVTGTVHRTILNDTSTGWVVELVENSVEGGLDVMVTGDNTNTVKWQVEGNVIEVGI